MDVPELPEIPVLEEHSPSPEPPTVAQSLHELPHGEPALRSGLAPAGDGLQHAEVEARRWSLDASLHSDWELLSHGAHSRCGSSPQSLLHSGYNSDAEGGPMSGGGHSGGVAAAARAAAALAADAFRSARQRAEAEDTAASSALDLPPVPRPDADPQVAPAATAEAEPQTPQPFGSLVLPAQGPLAGVAAGAAADLGPEPHGSASSSPRSSFEHTSSHASGHDLYSLSQDGSHDALSDHDSYIEDMMAAGEPGPDNSGHGIHGKHGGSSPEGSEGDDAELAVAGKAPAAKAHASLHLLAAAPAATLAAAAHGAYCAASSHLRILAASFSAYLARIVPAGAEVARHVVRGVAELVGTLQVQVQARLAPLPAGLGQLASKAAASAERAQAAVLQARKSFGLEKRIPWAKVALALGGVCGVTAVLLYRSVAEQRRLAALLARREADFTSLLMKIAELQRNISSYQSHSRLPIIRHVAASARGAASSCAASWPAVVVV